MSAPATKHPPFALLLAAAWLVSAGWLLAEFWVATGETLFDTDDAMRLVEVRAYLAGHGWFDLHEPRILPLGYDTHWSRLIDAGLAGLFLLFHLFADAPLAERLMRAVWPLLWLFPAIAGAAAAAWRLAGREAAMVVLVFAALGLPGFQQFTPGRIDHHNVQITFAVLALAATVWSDRVRWAAAAAGLVSGFALAIGLEGLPYLAACGAAFVLRYVLCREGAAALGDYALTLAAGTCAAFLVSVAPQQWTHTACDAIAINWALPAVAGGLALALGARASSRMGALGRCAVAAAAAAGVAALFLLLDPRCIGGPFAAMDPAAKAVWLAQVREMAPFVPFASESPVMGAWIAAFPVAAMAGLAGLAASRQHRADFALQVAGAAFVLALATTLLAIKAYSYAIWFAMPLVAAFAVRLIARLRLRMPAGKAALAVLLAPLSLSAVAAGVAQAAIRPPDAHGWERQACFESASYLPLAQIPAGLVAAPIDYGPFLLALTPHAVLAAPYHRLSAGLITAHRIFAGSSDEARAALSAAGASYLVTCAQQTSRPSACAQARGCAVSMRDRLAVGDVPDWLEPLPASSGEAFAVYRIRR